MPTAKQQPLLKSGKERRNFLLLYALANSCLFWLLAYKYVAIAYASNTFFATSFYDYATWGGKALVLLFTLATYLGHFALLAFLPCLLLVPVCYFIQRAAFIIIISVSIWSLLVTLLLADLITFSLFHFHLNFSLLKILFNRDYGVIQLIEPSSLEIRILSATVAGIILGESLLALFICKNMARPFFKKIINALPASIYFLCACLLFSYAAFILTIAQFNNVLAQQTPNYPGYNNILATLLPLKNSSALINRFSETRFSQPLFPIAPLNYPLKPLHCKNPRKPPYNVLMIAIDTWRADAFNFRLTPHLAQFSESAWTFENHFSGGNSTQAGLFSLFYGLPSNYWSAMLKEKRGALLIDELLQQQYSVEILFSSNMVPPFNKTIFQRVLNLRLHEAAGITIADHDRAITQEFKTFLETRNRNQAFFTFLFYDAAHSYYAKQNMQKIFPTSDTDGERLTIIRNKQDKVEVIHRYYNAVHFIDTEINQLLVALKERDLLKNTVVIITSDHGEEFDDNQKNYWGHGSNYTPYQIKVPLIVYWPGQTPKIWKHKTSHYDITPFLMQNLLGCQNAIADYAIGEKLLTPHQSNDLLVGSYLNMSIVSPDKSMTLLTTGNIQINDNDALELGEEKADQEKLAHALFLMRKYFAKPSL